MSKPIENYDPAAPPRADTWPCWVLYRIPDPHYPNGLEEAYATWHTTADKARLAAAELNKAWAAGSLTGPAAAATEFHAEGPVIGAPGDRRGAQAVRQIITRTFGDRE